MLNRKFVPYVLTAALLFIGSHVTSYGQMGDLEELWDEVRGVGVAAGFSLDPELVYIGAYAQAGPVFKNLWVRPSIEYAFGEITDLVSINPEAVYYFGGRASDWNVYAGAGLAFVISRVSFENDQGDVDFSDWDADTGMNLILGASRPNGMLFEVKAGAYGAPGVKALVGYTFQ